MAPTNVLDCANNKENVYLGHLLLKYLRMKPKDAICQIDAADGSKETYSSVLRRSIRLARALTRAGLVPGDPLALGGPNHLDLHIPYYAAMFAGLPMVGVDPYYKYNEIKTLFNITRPKIAFCPQDYCDVYAKAAKEIGIEVKIISFDGEYNMEDFIETYDEKGVSDEDYQPATPDPDDFAWLVSTSGSTGFPKVAALTHRTVTKKCISFMQLGNFGNGKLALNLSPVQWLSSYYNAVCLLLLEFVKLQTSKPDDLDHVVDIINQYKPSLFLTSPSLPSLILKQQRTCDWTCFDNIILTGSKVHKELAVELRRLMRPEAILTESYGQTETIGPVLFPNPLGPLGSCGKPVPTAPCKLIDPETQQEITEPHVTGELWVKGEFFAGYYNDPEETAKVYSPDGWLMTGDLLYRDKEDNYFYVDRLKMVIKYREYHVIPPEVEGVILRHPGVMEVGVAGLPHREDGERPAALVVLKPGVTLCENELDDFVAASLSDKKRLRGGIAFVEEIPKTSSGKVARGKLKQQAITLLAHKND